MLDNILIRDLREKFVSISHLETGVVRYLKKVAFSML